MNKSLITAHSGCDGTADNSMEFLQYALNIPVDHVEVDVRMNPSDRLVMAHDPNDLSAPLEDAFEMLGTYPAKKINCDLKAPGLEQAIWNLAEEKGVNDRLQYSGTVSINWVRAHPGLVEWMLNAELLLPDLYQSVEKVNDREYAKQAARQIFEVVHENLASCINISYKLYDTTFCRLLREREVPFSVWTPSTEEEVAFFLDEGVYNMTTRNALFACGLRAKEHTT